MHLSKVYAALGKENKMTTKLLLYLWMQLKPKRENLNIKSLAFNLSFLFQSQNSKHFYPFTLGWLLGLSLHFYQNCNEENMS